jgi:ElaB/YqjD/DUF883 family membrane-anchored ribosome-binding protein
MFSRSGYSHAISAEIGNIDQRLRSLERQLERVGGRSAANAAQAADRVGETIVSALQGMADRLQGGANSVRDEVAKIGSETAAKIGSEAAKLGNHSLRRLSNEVEHRPLVMLAVAVGVGILVGLASHHRATPQRAHQRRRR